MTPGESVLHRHLGLPICSIPVGTSGAGQDTEGCVSPHSGKNHPEERDEVSCLANGLTRTSIGHQDARPEAPAASGPAPVSLVETALEDSSPRGTLASSGDGEQPGE